MALQNIKYDKLAADVRALTGNDITWQYPLFTAHSVVEDPDGDGEQGKVVGHSCNLCTLSVK